MTGLQKRSNYRLIKAEGEGEVEEKEEKEEEGNVEEVVLKVEEVEVKEVEPFAF